MSRSEKRNHLVKNKDEEGKSVAARVAREDPPYR